MTSIHTHPVGGAVAPLLARALANNWWKFLLRGVVAIVFGVLAFAWPGATLLALAMLWGAYALIDGALALWAAIAGGGAAPRWWLAIVGVVGIAAGVFTFMSPGLTTLVLLMFIGVWAILTGLMQVVGALRLRKEIDGEWFLILGGLLSIAFGVLMLTQPVAGAVATVWLLAGFAIAIGVLFVLLAFRLKKHKTA